MTTGFPVGPLTPATFLLVGLANVDLADHHRRTIPYAFGVTLLMTLAALASGAMSYEGRQSPIRRLTAWLPASAGRLREAVRIG